MGIGGTKMVAQGFEGNTKLEKIVIGRNRMESEGCGYVSSQFAKMKQLKEIRLPQNSIRPKGIAQLMTDCAVLVDLQVLDVQDNTFTKIGSKGLVAALPAWTALRILNIGECLLGNDGSGLVIKALTGSFDLLEELYLSYNEINSSVELIPAMLQGKGKLSKLELNGNCFDAEADIVADIVAVLTSNGYPDALDELDDMEEPSSDEEGESSDASKVENEDSKTALDGLMGQLQL